MEKINKKELKDVAAGLVETKEMKTSSIPDPMRALQGKVAGMTVTTSGSPDGGAKVRIR